MPCTSPSVKSVVRLLTTLRICASCTSAYDRDWIVIGLPLMKLLIVIGLVRCFFFNRRDPTLYVSTHNMFDRVHHFQLFCVPHNKQIRAELDWRIAFSLLNGIHHFMFPHVRSSSALCPISFLFKQILDLGSLGLDLDACWAHLGLT